MAELKFLVTLDSSAFHSDSQKVIADVKRISDEAQREGRNVQRTMDGMAGDIGKSLSKYAAMFGGVAALKAFIGQMVQVRSEFQKTDVAIQTMLGSKEKADALLSEVREYAKISPLEFGDITRATQMMLSFNIEASKVPGFIKAIGDVSMGEKDRFNSLSLAFSQMSATGKLMGQDLNQMINAGFNPLTTMAEKSGKSIAQLKYEMSEGAISAKMVQKAFIDATSAGGKFYKMSENAAGTISGQLSMLSDAVDAALNKIGTQSEGIIMQSIQGVTSLVENYESLIKVLGVLVVNYGVYKAACIAAIAIENAKGVSAALAAARTSLLETAQAALNKTMLANPYVAAAMALSALASAIYAAATATDEFDKAQERVSDAAADVEAQTSRELKKLNDLYQKLLECEEGSDEYKKVRNEIISQFGQYYSNLDTEFIKVGDLAAMYDKLTTAIRNSIAARQLQSFVKQQQDYYDKSVGDAFKKAYKTLIDKYGEVRGSELYQKFYRLSTQKKSEGITAQDWKDLQGATFFDVRWGKNAKDGLVDVRANVVDLAHSIWDVGKSVDEATKKFKEMYQITDEQEKKAEEKPEKPEPTNIDPKEIEKRKRAAAKAHREASRRAKEQADEADKLTDLRRRQATEEERAEADIELQVRDAEIKAMREGTDKKIKEIELARDKEVVSIQRWYEDLREERIEEAKKLFDAQKKNDGKRFFDSDEYKAAASDDAYTQQENAAYARMMTAAIEAYKNAMRDIADSEAQSMRDYLKQYGTYQEQRLAIAEEYAKKIAEAQSEGERLALAKERDNALAERNAKSLAMSIDWGTAFKGVGNVLGDIARETLAKVEAYMKTSEFKGLDAQQKKTYTDLREQLRAETGAGSASPFAFKQWGVIAEQTKQYQQAVQRLQNAQNRHTIAVAELANATERAKNAATDQEKAQAEVAVSAAKLAVTLSAQEQTDAQAAADKAKNNLTDSTNAAAQGIADFGNHLNEMKNGSLFGFTNGLTKLITSLGKGSDQAAKGLMELGGKIGGIIGAILQILDALGDAPAEFLGDLLDHVGEIVNKVLADLPQIVGNVAKGVLNIVKGIFNGIAGWFVGGTENEAKRTTERLTESNEALRHSIDKLTDKIGEEAGGTAIDAYKQARRNQSAYEGNLQQILQAQMGKWGEHRSNAYYLGRDLSNEDWRIISGVVGRQVSSVYELMRLTPDMVEKIRTELPSLWTRIVTAGKYDDVGQYWEAYADEAGKAAELTDAINESLTQTSFDSIVSSFEDALMDMDTSASDWSDNFAEMMQRSLLHFAIGDEFQNKLRTWYDGWAKTMQEQNGKLTEAQINIYRGQWNAFLQEGIATRDEIAKITGYTGSDGEGSGAYKAVSSFSQEQGDELNGRLTAIQFGQERQTAAIAEAVNQLRSLTVVMTDGGTLGEMRNLMLISNSHLEDIARYTRITAEYSDRLDEIANKIKTL